MLPGHGCRVVAELVHAVIRKVTYLQLILEEIGRRSGVDLARLCREVYGTWLERDGTCIMPEEKLERIGERDGG